MGLPVFKHEFDEVVAAMPPLPKLVFSRSTSGDPLTDIRQRVEIFSARLDDWHSQARRWVPEIRALFEHAATAGESESIEMMLHNQMPRLLAELKSLIDEISLGLVQLRELFSQMKAHRSAEVLPLITLAQNDVDEAFAKLLRIVDHVRDDIRAIEWDFDPESKGGTAFDSPDDLIASLNS